MSGYPIVSTKANPLLVKKWGNISNPENAIDHWVKSFDYIEIHDIKVLLTDSGLFKIMVFYKTKYQGEVVGE
jgi:hypothetical protein